jgi:hypothetical protein
LPGETDLATRGYVELERVMLDKLQGRPKRTCVVDLLGGKGRLLPVLFQGWNDVILYDGVEENIAAALERARELGMEVRTPTVGQLSNFDV